MSDLEELLRRGLGEARIAVPDGAVERLLGFVGLLERWAARINLTGHRDGEAILRRLVLDAVGLWAALPRAASLADLGSGAGLPGLPVAIVAPEVRVVLVESRLRRHHFQKTARRELSLDNVALRLGRMEQLAPEPCDLVVAQAVAPPATVLDWMRPWARPGGWLAIPGVAEDRDPLADPTRAASRGLKAAGVRRYRAPLEGRERVVWLARLRCEGSAGDGQPTPTPRA
jgi:16S rRNA (guanine527-N7)-methyltransferase